MICDTCPFTSDDPDAIRGHEAGPHTGRGWLGQNESHVMRDACQCGQSQTPHRRTDDRVTILIREERSR